MVLNHPEAQSLRRCRKNRRKRLSWGRAVVWERAGIIAVSQSVIRRYAIGDRQQTPRKKNGTAFAGMAQAFLRDVRLQAAVTESSSQLARETGVVQSAQKRGSKAVGDVPTIGMNGDG